MQFQILWAVSRKIVGYEVYENESSKQLADVVRRATLLEGGRAPKILHSDNGSPMKGSSLLELCYKMGFYIFYLSRCQPS